MDSDPLKLCEFLLGKCREAGVQVHHPATALSIHADVRGELSNVVIGYTDSSEEMELPATRLLLAAGAWTPRVFKTLFSDSSLQIQVSAFAGHSLVVKSPKAVEENCHSVYMTHGQLSPELYSRPNGVIYLAGVNSPRLALPELATGAKLSKTSVDQLKDIAKQVIDSDSELEVVRAGLCFRPVTDKGIPVLARIRDEDLGSAVSTRKGAEGGVFVATGHGPWGISLSLGTGKVMAEMMQGRQLSCDVGKLGIP